MAHKKAAAATASQKGNRPGKHRGVKHFAGELVQPGDILVRQVGSVFVAGENVGTGRDFTLFATKAGKVEFKHVTKAKKAVHVIEVAG